MMQNTQEVMDNLQLNDVAEQQCNVPNRTMFCNDNLEILSGINSAAVDLIYLDPPFNKNKEFTASIGSSAEGANFSDIFRRKDVKDEWVRTIAEDHDELYGFLHGIKTTGRNSYNYCYLCYMAIRLIACRRILKDSGSIYLHCDPTMSHYLKIVMDGIFGEQNFRNEIIWSYQTGGASKRHYAKKHDIILFYSKSDTYFIDLRNIKVPRTEKSLARARNPIGARITVDDTEKLPTDVIDIPALNPMAKERTGYPTQKPLALLERIIAASSKEGGVVLDPFCGCATTCIAAEKLGRQWIGIDISIKAYELVQTRAKDEVWDNTDALEQYQGAFPRIHCFTYAPTRTDRGHNAQEQKYVYIISHTNYPDEYKVGIARSWKSRLNAYQTADPDRSFKVEYYILTPHYRALETHIHKKFDNKHEWVRGDLADIIAAIDAYSAQHP